MKSREQKQKDLEALTEQLSNSKSAVVVSFTKLTVNKDQEIRNELREAGAKYQVVKNTLARLAVKGTPYEEATEHFQGVTAIAWTDGEPVNLSKAVSKFIKENDEIFTFKTGIVEGKVVDFDKIKEIASLPSKDELIGKLLYLLNAPAQRLATVLSAIPRDLAVVLQQVSEGKGTVKTEEKAEAKPEEKAEAKEEKAEAKEETKAEDTSKAKVEEPKAEEVKPEAAEEKTAEEPKQAETAEAETAETPAPETEEKTEAPADEATDESEAKEEKPKAEASSEAEEAAPEEKSAADDDSDEKTE